MNDDAPNAASASTVVPAESADETDDAAKSTDGEDEEIESVAPKAAPTSDSLRQVSTAEAEAYAKESHLLFYEASAKTGQNVGDLFTEIGEFLDADTQRLLLTFAAKTIPVDTVVPKSAPAGRRSGNANAAGQADGNVNLGDGQQAKKAGGCC